MIRKIQRLFALHGFVGAFQLCATKAYRYLLQFTPSQRSARALAEERDLEFDRKWGVDTSGAFVPRGSEVVGSHWIYGLKYHGCDSAGLEQLLNELPIQHEHFTFVDFGSGKGRALLTALRFPFKRIIGVEYSEQLNEVARSNVSRFPNNEKRCTEVDIVCADAAKFPIPQTPLIIFLFNPFGRSVMSEVVRNVLTSFQEDPRRIIVLYFNATFADLWKNAGFLHEIKASKWLGVYDTQV